MAKDIRFMRRVGVGLSVLLGIAALIVVCLDWASDWSSIALGIAWRLLAVLMFVVGFATYSKTDNGRAKLLRYFYLAMAVMWLVFLVTYCLHVS